MEEKTVSSTFPHRPENLAVRTEEELEDFWRTILPDFVKNVDPENSGFLQDLYSDQILTHTDYESLVSGKDYVPRAQKARKLWLVLSSYNLGLFRAKIAPRLLASFTTIVPDRFFTANDQLEVTIGTQHQCLRHDIQKRVRMEKMADLLVYQGCLSLKDYRVIINETTQNTTAKWNLLLDMFPGQTWSKQASLQPELQELLRRYHVPFPDNMADFLSRGFPCTCSQAESIPPDDVQSRDTTVQSWLERKVWTVCQRSTDSSFTRADVSSLSSSLRPISEHDTVSITSDMTGDEETALMCKGTAMCHSDRESMKNQTRPEERENVPPSACAVDIPLSSEQSDLFGGKTAFSGSDDGMVKVQIADQSRKTINRNHTTGSEARNTYDAVLDLHDHKNNCFGDVCDSFTQDVSLLASLTETCVCWCKPRVSRYCGQRMRSFLKLILIVYCCIVLISLSLMFGSSLVSRNLQVEGFSSNFVRWHLLVIAIVFMIIVPVAVTCMFCKFLVRALWKKLHSS